MGADDRVDEVLTSAALAALLDVHPRTLAKLADEGKVERAPGRGRYLRDASVRKYVAHLRQVAAGRGEGSAPGLTDERTREAKARADKLEINNAKARGEVVPVATVESEWVTAAIAVRGRLLAVPSRMLNAGMSKEVAARLNQELREALSDLADSGGKETA